MTEVDPRTFGGRLVHLRSAIGSQVTWEFPNARQREACVAFQRKHAAHRIRTRKLQRAARRQNRAAA